MMYLIAGSSVSMGTALLNTLMGMGTVFVVLIFISFIISLFKHINNFAAKNEPPKIEQKSAPVAPIVEAEEEPEELSDDMELVAVITAAIAAYEGTSQEGFQVRSIKRAAKRRW